MKTKLEIKNWILENCIDDEGDIDISGLDFSDFNGNIYIGNMQVKGSLFQDFQEVKGNLIQDNQYVKGELRQDKKENYENKDTN